MPERINPRVLVFTEDGRMLGGELMYFTRKGMENGNIEFKAQVHYDCEVLNNNQETLYVQDIVGPEHLVEAEPCKN